MEIICKNKDCNNMFIKVGKRVFCSRKCSDNARYINNKEKYKLRAKKWRKNNRLKKNEIDKKANKKYWKKKGEGEYNRYMLNRYHTNRRKGGIKMKIKRGDLVIEEIDTSNYLILVTKTYKDKVSGYILDGIDVTGEDKGQRHSCYEKEPIHTREEIVGGSADMSSVTFVDEATQLQSKVKK